MTADETGVAGWFHSWCTVGTDPKPICTGCTLHKFCVTYSDLASYKRFPRCYGGKPDNDLTNTRNENVFIDQK